MEPPWESNSSGLLLQQKTEGCSKRRPAPLIFIKQDGAEVGAISRPNAEIGRSVDTAVQLIGNLLLQDACAFSDSGPPDGAP